jgi:DNA-binding SARP family transcriptional activator
MTEEERQAKLASLTRCKQFGEKAYDDMYEAHSPNGASGCYSDAKEAFYDAIRLAEELGMPEDAEALRKRLEHIKAVFRSQFA